MREFIANHTVELITIIVILIGMGVVANVIGEIKINNRKHRLNGMGFLLGLVLVFFYFFQLNTFLLVLVGLSFILLLFFAKYRRAWAQLIAFSITVITTWVIFKGSINIGPVSFPSLGHLPKMEGSEIIGWVFYSTLVIFSWVWRHRALKDPQEWNIDPEAEPSKRGPQKNYWAIYGNHIFHAGAFLALGFPSILLADKKVSMFFTIPILFLIMLAMWIIIVKLRGMKDGVVENNQDPFQTIKQRSKKEIFWWILAMAASAIILGYLLNQMLKRIDFGITAFLLMPLGLLLSGIYAVHIRGQLIPFFWKKALLSNMRITWILLLGKGSLGPGPHFTLFFAILPGAHMYLIDHSVWEVEDIQTTTLPTLGADGNPGPPIVLLLKMTIQIYNADRYLGMKEEDRAKDKITGVIMRYLLDATMDLTRQLSYKQVKMENYYQYPVRLEDVETFNKTGALPAALNTNPDHDNPNHIVMEYDKHAKLWIKTAVDDPYEYVGYNEEGVFRRATFFEYVDWLLRVHTGCRLVELGVLDASSEKLEEVEEARLVSEIQMVIDQNRLKGQGLGELSRLEEMKKFFANGEDLEKQALVINAIERILGAENAGMIFNLVKGIEQKVSGGKNKPNA